MQPVLYFTTKVGTFYICQDSEGRFHPAYNDETFGGYDHIVHAVEDIANDAVGTVLHKDTHEVIDTSLIGLPDEPHEWVVVAK